MGMEKDCHLGVLGINTHNKLLKLVRKLTSNCPLSFNAITLKVDLEQTTDVDQNRTR
jgi:hypothetical protein